MCQFLWLFFFFLFSKCKYYLHKSINLILVLLISLWPKKNRFPFELYTQNCCSRNFRNFGNVFFPSTNAINCFDELKKAFRQSFREFPQPSKNVCQNVCVCCYMMLRSIPNEVLDCVWMLISLDLNT